MRTVPLVLGALLCWAAPGWTAELTGDDIKAKVIGRQFSWRSVDGRFSGVVRYAKNGVVTTSGNLPANLKSDTGTWRLSGNQLCTKFKKLRQGQETCPTYQLRPDGTIFSTNDVILTPR
jgi:hypothetical protein